MTQSHDDAGRVVKAANVLGAVATAVSDLVVFEVQRASGLDLTSATALLVVAERPARPVTHLAATLLLTHSGAVRVADRLQTRGLLARATGQDGRSVGLRVTPHGRAVVEQAHGARERALLTLIELLPTQQRAGLVDGVRALARVLAGDRLSAHRICRLCDHDVCRGPDCPVGSAVPAGETLDEDRRQP